MTKELISNKPKILSFEDLLMWQKSKLLILEIYKAFLDCKDLSFKNQIQGASVSIMNNIAEGFGRKGNLEFINFLTYSSGSACECKSQLYRAYDRNYITEEK